MTPERQIELLQTLFAMDVWNEFLVPSYKEAQEILINNMKASKDKDEVFGISKQLTGLDAILNLPIHYENLKAQLLIAQKDAEAPKAPRAPVE